MSALTGRWERVVDWLFLTRSGAVCWWTTQGAAVFGLTLFLQHLGWHG
ncbi:hypothetical protein ACWC09_26110 [Streptomyces sp. NPDC001617]